MQTTIRALLGALLVVSAFGVALAKLPPAPPMTDQQKAEKAAKDKATADAEKSALARAEDKAVANYHENMKAKGQPVNAPAPGGAEHVKSASAPKK